MAEGVGFEPTDPYGSPVFKTGALNRSYPSSSVAKFGKYANNGGWRAARCEYFRTMVTAATIITSMGSRSTESESAFFLPPKRKPKEALKKWDRRIRKEGEDALAISQELRL
jgi:hypothetical protein